MTLFGDVYSMMTVTVMRSTNIRVWSAGIPPLSRHRRTAIRRWSSSERWTLGSVGRARRWFCPGSSRPQSWEVCLAPRSDDWCGHPDWGQGRAGRDVSRPWGCPHSQTYPSPPLTSSTWNHQNEYKFMSALCLLDTLIIVFFTEKESFFEYY